MNKKLKPAPAGKKYIFRPYITRNGKRIYRPGGQMWPILVNA